jgi:hypothetical protein
MDYSMLRRDNIFYSEGKQFPSETEFFTGLLESSTLQDGNIWFHISSARGHWSNVCSDNSKGFIWKSPFAML